MSRKKHLRAWARLRVLCCSGLDPVAAAPDAFALIREIVPNAAGALFLTSPQGVPHAFFHEDSPASAQRLFLEEPHLFRGPGEYNVFRLVGEPGGAKVGQLMEPPADYWRSHTYQLLVRASGHHHTLDARLEVDGHPAGLVSLFRPPGSGFREDDRDAMARVAAHLEQALRTAPAPAGGPTDAAVAEAMLVCTPQGRLLHASARAMSLLQQLPLAGTQWPDRKELPPFCRELIRRLHDADNPDLPLPHATRAVPGGHLQVTAQWLAPVTDPPGVNTADALVGILLRHHVPAELRAWRRLNRSDLSPRELEVAFWLRRTGSRQAVRERLGLSEAVMRDCVRAVYAEYGCGTQEEFRLASAA
ncbi:MAG TPA: hypothetical protein VNO84_03395 [Burkholderiaceae bacterium]|nr:hypothetical protein [Burkholderiaceae bacterium]